MNDTSSSGRLRTSNLRADVVAMNILNSKEWEKRVDNMRRRKLRGDLTVNNEYRSNRNINDWDTTHYDPVDTRRKVNDLTYAKILNRCYGGGSDRRRFTTTWYGHMTIMKAIWTLQFQTQHTGLAMVLFNSQWPMEPKYICVITSRVEVGKMVRKIRTRAIVDALVVNGMKNKLVVDSETKKNKWEELSTPEVVNDVEN